MSQTAKSNLPARVIRYGTDEPLAERSYLRAGPVTAVIEGNALRYIRVGEHEIVRSVYMAVRDRNWDTIAPNYLSYSVLQDERGFTVQFRVEHVERDIDFVWDATITGMSDGTVTYEMDGECRSTFMKNRIGICLLHPMSLAGVSTRVWQSEDRVIDGVFPVAISPTQPFFDMMAMRYEVGDGIVVDTKFEGDLFEMEDQRNWTDASYKTYSTPLGLPFPVLVEAGQRIRQVLTLTVTGAEAVEPHAEVATADLRVGSQAVGRLPAVGLSTASHGHAITAEQTVVLRELVPEHLRCELSLDRPGWESVLQQGAHDAQALGAALVLDVVTDSGGTGLRELCQTLAQGGIDVARLMAFDRARSTTTDELAALALFELRGAGVNPLIGGGSRAYFTEFNRATLSLEPFDFVGWGTSPQAHAFDNASLMETLETQAVTVESGRAIAGELPIAVGPITLKPRFNPNATGPAPEPAPGQLPFEVDPRQMSLLTAAWLVGSLRHLGESGVQWATYFETTGQRGVIDDDRERRHPLFLAPEGAIYPAYYVLATIAGFAEGELLDVSTSNPLAAEVLALRLGDRLLVLAANLTDTPKQVGVEMPGMTDATLRVLDETTAGSAMASPEVFRRETTRELGNTDGPMTLELAPYAVARIEGRLA